MSSFFYVKGGIAVNNGDYKRFIVDMLNHVEDNKALKAIYLFVQKHFLHK